MCFGHQLLDRINCSKRIGDGTQANKFGFAIQLLRIIGPIQNTCFCNLDEAYFGTRPLSQLLPWHDVGMVLHDRQQNFVAWSDIGIAPASGNRINGQRRAGRKDDLVGPFGTDKLLHLDSRLFVQSRGLFA